MDRIYSDGYTYTAVDQIFLSLDAEDRLLDTPLLYRLRPVSVPGPWTTSTLTLELTSVHRGRYLADDLTFEYLGEETEEGETEVDQEPANDRSHCVREGLVQGHKDSSALLDICDDMVCRQI